MFKKFDEDKLVNLLEDGIDEFALMGVDRANINTIAKKAGVSVGVIYKYYNDKDGFFLACVRHSIGLLNEVLKDTFDHNDDVVTALRKVIQALQIHAKKHPNHNMMYHEITAGSCRQYASMLADEIETISAMAYKGMIEEAKRQGLVRPDMNPKIFAFFFDNLLMMLQFSYSCDYYRERMKIYCGDDRFNDEMIQEELMKFICGALGIREYNQKEEES